MWPPCLAFELIMLVSLVFCRYTKVNQLILDQLILVIDETESGNATESRLPHGTCLASNDEEHLK